MRKITPIFVVAVLLLLVIASVSYAASPAPDESMLSPVIEPASEHDGDLPPPTFAPARCGGTNCHIVRWGETLFSIGRRYGVNPYQIAKANRLYNPNRIYAGQALYIPSGYGHHGRSGYGGGYHGGSGYGWDGCRSGCGRGYQGHSGYGWDGCRSGCGRGYQGHSGYGYDYTGYYYYDRYPKYRRYSYTCGYYYNCY